MLEILKIILDKKAITWYNKVIFNIGVICAKGISQKDKDQGENMERIKKSNHVVGLKQTKKAVQAERAKIVFIAENAERYIAAPLEELCRKNSVEVVFVSSMKELAKSCHVEVPTSAAAIVKDAD